jgi:hypothetical protein
MGGPEVAQHLRMLVADLWSAMSNRRDSDAAPALRRLSQEVERLARRLELEGC